MSANSQVAFTQLDEEVSTFYHRYSRGKENQALYLTAFGCLENSVAKAQSFLTAMSADAEAPNKSDFKKLLIRTRTMFEIWQNERDPKYKFPPLYYEIRTVISQYDRTHGRSKKGTSAKSAESPENHVRLDKKVSSPEVIEDSDSDTSVVIADFNPENAPLTKAGEASSAKPDESTVAKLSFHFSNSYFLFRYIKDMQVDDVSPPSRVLADITNTVSTRPVATPQADCARPSVVCLPFASVPGMDIFSVAYKRAVQAALSSNSSIELPLVSDENLKLCLGGIKGLNLNTKEIHRTFLANAPLEARQIHFLSNSAQLASVAMEMQNLADRYYDILADQKFLAQSFASPFTKMNLIKAVDKARTDKDSTRTPHEAFSQEVKNLLAVPQLVLLDEGATPPSLTTVQNVSDAYSEVVETLRLINFSARQLNSLHAPSIFQELQRDVINDMSTKTQSFGQLFESYCQLTIEFLWLEMMMSRANGIPSTTVM
ncbi:hypothetical protein AGABI1DRAFT_95887 [Agaricus bisporus var. burnettii JB137-S8]|uniref:Uncharacterized protein n=1 Tax=Agaricus bisporus var. burnettii (strain JB137-S8 / ATCC MYA-4627 / FGSC 10392) TaxID=597362 RepID=K5WTN3_AGABU|nr:uncharacterized protein AGABI1DRAFT_95887 [Agaricus bisporus var. burnettii JB137-S8]EKM74078.1 hypothetical protein AGABI1DRAFT_95887 [Agaricus bisporus var. burnettii JB137-S8]